MTYPTSKPQQPHFLYAALVACLGLVAPMVGAQSSDEDTLEEVTIVGSRVPSGSAQDSPVPVDSVDGDTLFGSGYPDVGQALQYTVPSFNYTFSSITDGTDSVLPATLRGLSPDQSLVLVDGKRRHASALVHVNGSVGRGSAGVDINAVPAVAFERVDVLRDGASALYGSDAIAGVMDLRLRRTSPATISLHSGEYSAGDGASTRLSFTWGDQVSDTGTVFVAVEARDRDRTNRAGPMGTVNYPELALADVKAGTPNARQQSQLVAYEAHVAAETAKPLAERSISTGCDATYNLLCDPREFTLPRQTFRIGDPITEQMSFVVNTVWQLGDGELYGNTTHSTRDNESGCFYREADDSNRNNPAIYPDGFLPRITTTIEDNSLTGGYRWQNGKAQYDVSYQTGENTYDFGLVNSHNHSLGTDSATTFTNGGPRYDQTLINFDGLIDVSDNVKVAFGAESRNESYNLKPGSFDSYAAGTTDNPVTPVVGPNVNPADTPPPAFGAQCFPGFRPATAGERTRDNLSAYTEVGIETELATISAAIRLEDYSDFGNAVTWRGAALLRLSDTLKVRGSIGTSLRAPSLPQLYYTTISTVSLDGVLAETATLPNSHQFLNDLGISQLTEESASNISLGLTWQIRHNLNLTFDYYSVDIEDRVILSGQLRRDRVSTRLAAARTAGESTTALDSVLSVFQTNGISRAQFFLNAAETETEGTDLVLEWNLSSQSGDLKLKLSRNMTETKVIGGIARPGNLQLFPESEIFTLLDRSRIEDYQPGEKTIISADYHTGVWVFGGSYRIFGDYSNTTSGGNTQVFDGGATLDLRATYNWREQLSVSLGGTNILDEYPEFNTLTVTRGGSILDIVDSPYGVFQYSNGGTPFGVNGAYYYGEISYKF